MVKCVTYRRGSEPGWQATKVPLGADVRAGAQNHQHVELLHDANELFNVLGAVPFVLSWVALVEVPRDVQLRPGAARVRSRGTPVL